MSLYFWECESKSFFNLTKQQILHRSTQMPCNHCKVLQFWIFGYLTEIRQVCTHVGCRLLQYSNLGELGVSHDVKREHTHTQFVHVYVMFAVLFVWRAEWPHCLPEQHCYSHKNTGTLVMQAKNCRHTWFSFISPQCRHKQNWSVICEEKVNDEKFITVNRSTLWHGSNQSNVTI